MSLSLHQSVTKTKLEKHFVFFPIQKREEAMLSPFFWNCYNNKNINKDSGSLVFGQQQIYESGIRKNSI